MISDGLKPSSRCKVGRSISRKFVASASGSWTGLICGSFTLRPLSLSLEKWGRDTEKNPIKKGNFRSLYYHVLSI